MLRKIRALMHDVLVPPQSEPLEPFVDTAGARVGAPGFIGVFDPQQKLTAVMLDEEPVEEGGARASDVQIAGWRGRESESMHAEKLLRGASWWVLGARDFK